MRRSCTKSIYGYSFLRLVLLIFSCMFLIIVFLTIKLITYEKSSCQRLDESINIEDNKFPVLPSEEIIVNKNHISGHKLAILVPYKDRFEELLVFAPYIHNFLIKQNVDHDIFILHQIDFFRFNRASLINVGFLATKDNYTYLAMHDVDLLPLNDNLLYKYPEMPLHIASPKFHPRYHYEKFIGGILLINREHFSKVNGLSNRYWGWGLEDDEFYVRLKDAKLTIQRPENITTGTTNTFKHIHTKQRVRDTKKCFNQKEVTRKRDKVTGLHDVKYNIKSRTKMNIEGAPLTIINVQLLCDQTKTPWCEC
ncbi:unnamed protein product [Brassicogethes aeneus]|uniref:Beta-1,4-N-acetylgalactosaminyltransferase n=1 Tax=Brassicogethes aeneus TaxID=1431903 RepID=A0A9P0FIA4_BRAAE|nr:unnamed protein product [Brassicogethes aeneus]